jgi:hypothetical protein
MVGMFLIGSKIETRDEMTYHLRSHYYSINKRDMESGSPNSCYNTCKLELGNLNNHRVEIEATPPKRMGKWRPLKTQGRKAPSCTHRLLANTKYLVEGFESKHKLSTMQQLVELEDKIQRQR